MFRFSPNPNKANLVNWREWGQEAFDAAQQQDKLVMLYIGAFWCGFCQGMDETTLSNNETITLLNAYFIPIRVENAQRPDIDARYNQDGWPSIAFLTPWGDHLATVNYMPPDEFCNVLAHLHQTYQDQQEEFRAAALNQQTPQSATAQPPTRLRASAVSEIVNTLMDIADPVNGGYGPDHKFLHPEAHDLLLYRHETTSESEFLDHVTLTLDKMRNSATYDSEVGGYFRYSSKADWSEPHREKLLADHAGILMNFLRSFILTENDDHRQRAEEVVDFLTSTMSDSSGAPFFGCQDYLRTAPTLGVDSQGRTTRTPGGIISIIDDWIYTDANAQVASAFLEASWVFGRPKLKQRALAVLEFLWTNCRTADNGMFHYHDGEPQISGLLNDQTLMGSALLDAYRFTGNQSYMDQAEKLGKLVLSNNSNPDGGYYDISERGPGHLRFPLTLLVDNGRAASFFLSLCDATGNPEYRRAALWALRAFTDDFAPYGVYASDYALALARYMSPPLTIKLEARPGDSDSRRLVRAVRIRLGQYRLTLCVRDSESSAAVYLGDGPERVGPIFHAEEIISELAASLQDTPA